MEISKLKEFLQFVDAKDFEKEVDLHIHTSCSDGKLSTVDVIKKVINEGYKTISITDHNTIEAYKHLESLDCNGLNIIKGVEFDCWHGYTLLHILGYGIDINNVELLNICAKSKIATEADIVRFFNKRKAKDVIKVIKHAGGIPVLAHPACCWNLNIKKMVQKLMGYGLEGLEVYYPYKRHRGIIKFYTNHYIDQLADEFCLLKTGGSDRHY